MNSILKIKKITTTMDLVGLCLSIVSAVLSTLLLVASFNAIQDSKDYLGSGDFDELVAGFQIFGGALGLFGSLLVGAFILILLSAIIAVLIAFLIPTIYGRKLQKNTNQYLENGQDIYCKYAKRDSIVKLIFNGIPCVCLFYVMVDQKIYLIILLLVYYLVICVLEIMALSKLISSPSSAI